MVNRAGTLSHIMEGGTDHGVARFAPSDSATSDATPIRCRAQGIPFVLVSNLLMKAIAVPTPGSPEKAGKSRPGCIHGFTNLYAALTPVNATGPRQAALAHQRAVDRRNHWRRKYMVGPPLGWLGRRSATSPYQPEGEPLLLNAAPLSQIPKQATPKAELPSACRPSARRALRLRAHVDETDARNATAPCIPGPRQKTRSRPRTGSSRLTSPGRRSCQPVNATRLVAPETLTPSPLASAPPDRAALFLDARSPLAGSRRSSAAGRKSSPGL